MVGNSPSTTPTEGITVKYIALLAMVKIVPTHPELVAEYQDMIVSSVDDQDVSIRMRALDLLSAMVGGNIVLVQCRFNTSLAGQQTQLAAHCAAVAIPSCPIRVRRSSIRYSVTVAIRICGGECGSKGVQCSLAVACLSYHACAEDFSPWFARHI